MRGKATIAEQEALRAIKAIGDVIREGAHAPRAPGQFAAIIRQATKRTATAERRRIRAAIRQVQGRWSEIADTHEADDEATRDTVIDGQTYESAVGAVDALHECLACVTRGGRWG